MFCSRDRAGKKPFYYYVDEARFIFSSEMKGIFEFDQIDFIRKSNISLESVLFYFKLGYIPSPFTIFKNIFKLEPRSNLIYSLTEKKIVKILMLEVN